MTKQKWAFWDAEALPQLLPAEELSLYERIWLIYTHKNPLPFCNSDQQQVLESRLQTKGNIPDIRSFMSFLLGQAHIQAGKEVAFRVFSTDKQLKSVIQHLNQQSRDCKRVVPRVAPPELTAQLVKVLQVLEKRPPALRPKTLEAMTNFIGNVLPETASVQEVWEELQARQLLELKDKEVVCVNEQLGWSLFLLLENLRSIPPKQRPAKYNRLINHIGTFFSRKVNPHLLVEQLREEKLLSVLRHNQILYHF